MSAAAEDSEQENLKYLVKACSYLYRGTGSGNALYAEATLSTTGELEQSPFPAQGC